MHVCITTCYTYIQAKMTTVEKELQDTVTEKNKALEKSNEKYQQLLEELEQYKVRTYMYMYS